MDASTGSIVDSATLVDQDSEVRKPTENSPLDAVDRALRLITLLRQHGRVSVTQVSDELGVSPSTAHRLLAALCYRDFAVQDRDRQYRAGPQLADSLPATLSVAGLRRVARPAVERLHVDTGETTHLVVLSGSDVRFIDGVEGEHALRIGLRIGVRIPAYCASGGKAMLAALPRSEVDRLHPGGLPPWPNARLRDLAALYRQLATVRRSGYGFNQEEDGAGGRRAGCRCAGRRRPAAGSNIREHPECPVPPSGDVPVRRGRDPRDRGPECSSGCAGRHRLNGSAPRPVW